MNQKKVDQANKVYMNLLWIIDFCLNTGCLLAVENPHRSWLWILIGDMLRVHGTPAMRAFVANMDHVIYDQRMHGGDRDKRTKLLASLGLFKDLALDCDNQHTHAPWTPYKADNRNVYPTTAEAEYPTMCASHSAPPGPTL